MTSLDNLEKLIQMATIEHMYSMLQKISNNTNNVNNTNNTNNTTTDSTISKNCINDELIKKLQNYDAVISSLTTKVHNLELELEEIKSNTNNNSRYLCQQIRGQQVLTSYPGFSNTSAASPMHSTKSGDEEHIILKIEEKVESGEGSRIQVEAEEEDDELEIGDYHPGLITCGSITLSEPVESVPPTKAVIQNESEEESEDESEEESEEQSEEEVGTEDETESLEEVPEKTTATQETQPTEKTEEDEEEEEEEEEEDAVVVIPVVEEEEEEEVFEIEIDDVTYFATHEENGILYDITSDGDVGNKVGIIKDGEPIFN